MSREQFKTTETTREVKDANALLRLRNRMQYEIAERHCAACSKPEFFDYIQHEIGPAFGKLVEGKPELLVQYEQDPAAALAEAEKELHLEHEMAEK